MIEYNENLSYEVVENGYKIYLNGRLWITQLDDLSKPMDARKTYEENCLLQLEELTTKVEAVDEETYKATENALNAFFDGIKYSNSEDTAIPVTMPMVVRANLWYKYEGKTYVCMPVDSKETTTILVEENFNDWLHEM